MATAPLLEVTYNDSGISQDMHFRWNQLDNITKHEIQFFTCNETLLEGIPVDASCSSAEVSGVNSIHNGLLLLAVKGCDMDDCSGSDGVDLMTNIIAINFSRTGIIIFNFISIILDLASATYIR